MNPINEKQTLERIDQAERAITTMRAFLNGAIIQISPPGQAKWHTLDSDKMITWNWSQWDYRVLPQSDTIQTIRKVKHRLLLARAALQGVKMQYRLRDIKRRDRDQDRWFPVGKHYYALLTRMAETTEEYEFRDANTGEIYPL